MPLISLAALQRNLHLRFQVSHQLPLVEQRHSYKNFSAFSSFSTASCSGASSASRAGSWFIQVHYVPATLPWNSQLTKETIKKKQTNPEALFLNLAVSTLTKKK